MTLTELFGGRWSMGDVVRFHTAHKLTLMAHQPAAYQRLGRLVASGATMERRAFQKAYCSTFLAALDEIATPGRHLNVLQHMLGYFKGTLHRDSRAELLARIDDYAAGRAPLEGLLTLFAKHIQRCGIRYLADQTYLQPCHSTDLTPRDLP